jgi:signal peptidase II
VKPIRFYLIALIIVIADQVSKWAILQNLPLGASRPALGTVLFLTHTHNTGGAFSLFPAANATFILIAALATLALIYAYHKMQRGQLIVSAALALALGGAIGNLIDRLRFGYVIDFFDLHGWTNHNIWPIFNVADSAITVGITLLAFHFLFTKEPAPEPELITATKAAFPEEPEPPAEAVEVTEEPEDAPQPPIMGESRASTDPTPDTQHPTPG